MPWWHCTGKERRRPEGGTQLAVQGAGGGGGGAGHLAARAGLLSPGIPCTIPSQLWHAFRDFCFNQKEKEELCLIIMIRVVSSAP